MKEPDSLDTLLREWKSPEPPPELDRKVLFAWRSAVARPRYSSRAWRRFWTMRVSVPAPALLAAVLATLILIFWLRSSAVQETPGTAGVVTRLNATGFQPLSDGQARVIRTVEIRK